MQSHDRHDFSRPNDPSVGDWNNFSLEDFSLYWDLPNAKEARFCYFEEIDFGSLDVEKPDIFPVRPSIEEAIIENANEKNFAMQRNYGFLSKISATSGLIFAYLSYLAF